MRLKILESLEDKKMMSSVEELIEQLWLKKNVFYVDVEIINCLAVQDISQKNVVVMIIKISLKKLFSFRTRSFMEI